MYLSSPASTRLALGPGSAVLILGPAVRVLVGMKSSWRRSLVVGPRSLAHTTRQSRADDDQGHHAGRITVSRCRTDSGGPAKAAPPDGAADSTAGAASRRASASWDS